MRLALALGWPSVAWGLARISSRELVEWMAFDAVEPLGESRADLRMGIVAATVANVNRASNQPAVAPADFVPGYWDEEPDEEDAPADWQGMLATVEALNAAFGGADARAAQQDGSDGDTGNAVGEVGA